MVILVPDTTRLPTLTGRLGIVRSGLNQVTSTMMPSPANAAAGTPMRMARTRALWRRALRIKRARSRGPLARQACVPTLAVWVAMVRAVPLPAARAGCRAASMLSVFSLLRAAKLRRNMAGARQFARKLSGMGEYVFRRPAGKIEPRAIGKEAEAGGGELPASFAGDQDVELLLDGVQVDDIGCRIGDLGVRQLLGAPVGELLLLGEIDAEHVAHQVLEPVLVRIGAGQAGSDFGAIDRDRHDSERLVQSGEIEAGEMEDLDDRWVGKQPLQVGRLAPARWNLHHVGRAVPRRKLHHAQPVAVMVEPHGLGVDRRRIAIPGEVGQVAAMQADGHRGSPAGTVMLLTPCIGAVKWCGLPP